MSSLSIYSPICPFARALQPAGRSFTARMVHPIDDGARMLERPILDGASAYSHATPRSPAPYGGGCT